MYEVVTDTDRFVVRDGRGLPVSGRAKAEAVASEWSRSVSERVSLYEWGNIVASFGYDGRVLWDTDNGWQ